MARVRGLPTSWKSAARRSSRPGRRLVDDGEGVREHVFVPVDRILFEGELRKLRHELCGEPGPDDEPQRAGGNVEQQHLVELVADPLGGDDRQPAVHTLH